MSNTLSQIQKLVVQDLVRISNHGHDELAADELSVRECLTGITSAQIVEDYPTHKRGPCVLVLQKDRINQPFHVVWGIPAHKTEPAVLITAYRPDPAKWSLDFLRRKP